MMPHIPFKKERNASLDGGLLYFWHPSRDWFIGFCIVLCICVCGVAYIVYDFYLQFYMTESSVVSTKQTIVYEAAEILEYAELYTERNEVFETLRMEYAPAVVQSTFSGEQIVFDEGVLVNE